MAKKNKDSPIKVLFDKAAEYGLTPDELKILTDPITPDHDLTIVMSLVSKGFLNDGKYTDKAKEILADLTKLFKLKPDKVVLDLPLDMVNRYNEMFPEMKLPSGKYARCNEKEVMAAFQWFFKNYPKFNDWNTIFKATEIYLVERESKNWEFTRRSMYFIRKTFQDKSVVSDLAEFYKRVIDGVVDQPRNNNSFEEKVV